MDGDLVQDTFLSAYQSYEKFEGKSNIKTWLLSILTHKIADYFRSRYKTGKEVPAGVLEQFFDENDKLKPETRPREWGNEKELLNDPEFGGKLKGCIEKLPERWSGSGSTKIS